MMMHSRLMISCSSSGVITGALAGGRYQLQIDSGSTSSTTKDTFNANVSAEYSGIVGSAGGSGDTKTKQEYADYMTQRTVKGFVLGGALVARSNLDLANDDFGLFQAWADSASISNCQVFNVELTDLPTILAYSQDPDTQAAGVNLSSALAYFQSLAELEIYIGAMTSSACTLSTWDKKSQEIRVSGYTRFRPSTILTPLTTDPNLPLAFGFTIDTSTDPGAKAGSLTLRYRAPRALMGTWQLGDAGLQVISRGIPAGDPPRAEGDESGAYDITQGANGIIKATYSHAWNTPDILSPPITWTL